MRIRLTGQSIMAGIFLCTVSATALADEEKKPSDEYWGKAYEAAKKAQIENPDADKCPRPVTGLDGRAAQKAVEGYEASFTPAKKDFTNVNWTIGNKQ